jgi:hypothetical protein
VEKAASRMFAFEMQFGPYAVAQLRLIAEMQAEISGVFTSGPYRFGRGADAHPDQVHCRPTAERPDHCLA